MKSCYELAERVQYDYLWASREKRSSHWMQANIDRRVNAILAGQQPSGRNHYTAAERQHVRAAMLAASWWIRETMTIHGYWYQGEFYTTSTRSNGHKTTSVLHDLRLSQDTWQTMESGFYYTDTLDPFYIGSVAC